MSPNLVPSPSSASAVAPGRESGVVLLLVMLVLALVSVLVLSWAQEWRTELKLAANFREAHQCRRLAEAGVYYALGKLYSAKMAETSAGIGGAFGASSPEEVWQADQRPYQLQLPTGKVEVRLGDEGGKINLNQAPEDVLLRFFLVLGFSEPEVRTMVDSILDWRTKEDPPRPFGAKNAYYLGLDPPYVCKNGPFDTVEELAWVHGFEGRAIIPRLYQWLTAQGMGQGININTAPPEVLQALGLPPDLVRIIIDTRETMPFRSFAEVTQLAVLPALGQTQQVTFQSSPFFTIKSTGMVNNKKALHVIKAIIKVDAGRFTPWEIVTWIDDFPG